LQEDIREIKTRREDIDRLLYESEDANALDNPKVLLETLVDKNLPKIPVGNNQNLYAILASCAYRNSVDSKD
jgi:hypothetical protein